MKPILFKHAIAIKESFFALHDRQAYFYDQLHYHPEYQITYIAEGNGTFFIADHMERFEAGDLYVIGANLPHVFRCDNEYYEKGTHLKCECVSVYFSENSFGPEFFKIPETKSIAPFLAEAERGLKINRLKASELLPRMMEVREDEGLKKIASLLLLLTDIADLQKKDRKPLASLGFIDSHKVEDNDKMSRVFAYIMKNFTLDIRLDDVAEVACMSSTAFCRYFKKRTGKSLVEFMLEARVGYACKLLQEEKLTVSEIAYQSGFKNISNFNRQFKSITAKTPTDYLDAFRRKRTY